MQSLGRLSKKDSPSPKKRAQVSGKDAEEKDKKQRQTVSPSKCSKPLAKRVGQAPPNVIRRPNRWRSGSNRANERLDRSPVDCDRVNRPCVAGCVSSLKSRKRRNTKRSI